MCLQVEARVASLQNELETAQKEQRSLNDQVMLCYTPYAKITTELLQSSQMMPTLQPSAKWNNNSQQEMVRIG